MHFDDMRTSMYLDVATKDEITRLATQYQKTNSQIARALIKAGICIIENGGIKIRGALLGFDRPAIEVRYKGLTGKKERFGVRLQSIENEMNKHKKHGESLSGCAASLLHLGLIAHKPDSFELTGPFGLPRPLAKLKLPKVDTEAILREE